MPVEAGLEFMAVIGSNSLSSEGELFNDMVDEVD